MFIFQFFNISSQNLRFFVDKSHTREPRFTSTKPSVAMRSSVPSSMLRAIDFELISSKGDRGHGILIGTAAVWTYIDNTWYKML